jgi:hypothetical protein
MEQYTVYVPEQPRDDFKQAIQRAFKGPHKEIGDEDYVYISDTVQATIEQHGGFLGDSWGFSFTPEGRIVFTVQTVEDGEVAKLVGDTLGVEIELLVDPTLKLEAL